MAKKHKKPVMAGMATIENGERLPAWTPFEVDPTYPERSGDKAGLMVFNSRYTVIVRKIETPGFIADRMVWLSIRSNDRAARHDWRDFQRIKNEILGDGVEAVELYPAETRLVDTCNQYHLFCLPAGAAFPFGYRDRLVLDEAPVPNAVQRPRELDNVSPSAIPSEVCE